MNRTNWTDLLYTDAPWPEALISTKLPILLGRDIWIFHVAQDIRRMGSSSMMHEARA